MGLSYFLLTLVPKLHKYAPGVGLGGAGGEGGGQKFQCGDLQQVCVLVNSYFVPVCSKVNSYFMPVCSLVYSYFMPVCSIVKTITPRCR